MHLVHVSHANSYRGGDRQMELLIGALRPYPIRQSAIVRAPMTAARLRALGDVAVVQARSPLKALRHLRGADLCHAHCGRAVQSAVLAKLRFGALAVATRRLARAPRRNATTRWLYRRLDGLAAVSAAVAEALHEYDRALKPRIVYDGVCADWLRRQRRDDPDVRQILPRAARGKFLVGQVAALDDRDKGQRLVLEVAARVADSHPGLHFVLIGDGPDRDALQQESRGLDNVSIVGWQQDVAGWYRTLDAVVAPSRREALGGSIIEAMQFGKPVVASRVGGIPELIEDGVSGLLFDLDDARALQARIERLSGDAPLRDRLSRNAAERARAFSVPRMAHDYMALYAATDQRFGEVLVRSPAG